MSLKPWNPNNQRGDITLAMAIIIATVMGTVIYFNVDKLNKMQASDRRVMQRDTAEQSNIAALSQATALMQYRGDSPASDKPNTLPYIYPDPYLPPGLNINTNSPIGRIRVPVGTPNWNYSAMRLNVFSPDPKDLAGDAFAQIVNNDVMPQNSSRATLKFLQAIRSTNPSTPYLIEKYSVEVTRPVTDRDGSVRQVTNRATVDVPTIKPPICRLSEESGKIKFQPNAAMNLKLEVWGVGTRIYFPATTPNLIETSHVNMTSKKIHNEASSIAGGAKEVHSWTVAAPRPLQAVDSTGNVTFKSYAFVEGPSQSGVIASCEFEFQVVAPATCKLWTNAARIEPGQCIDIYAAFVGQSVVASSLTLKATNAADPAQQSVDGLTHSPGALKGRFCPPQSTSGDPNAVPPETAEIFANTLEGLSAKQKQAVMLAMKEHVDRLKQAFPNDQVLHTLTIDQTNGLYQLSNSQIEDIENLEFDDYDQLKSITEAQKTALRKPENNAAILDLDFLELKTSDVLKKVSDKKLSTLESYNPILLAAFIQTTNAIANTSVDYLITGTVQDQSGTTNQCRTTLTVGPNSCPLFNSNFPNNCVDQTLWVIAGGGVPSPHNYKFCPGRLVASGQPVSSGMNGNSSWEVAGIADSPVSSFPCPPDARCYAVEGYEPRTPFVRIDNASSASCTVTTLNRTDLGCFRKGSKIRMVDGSDKAINLLKEGDIVFNPVRKRGFAIKRITAGMEAFPLLAVSVGSSTVYVTREHAFVTKLGVKKAIDLRNDDEILQEDGGFQRISSLKASEKKPDDEVWNIEVLTDSHDAEDHVILADGIITGDLYLQESLKQLHGKNYLASPGYRE